MVDDLYEGDGWQAAIAPLRGLVDLDATAYAQGALVRRRGVRSGEALLRLAVAWAAGGLSLRRAAAWAGSAGVGALCDSALLRRLRKADDWLEGLVQSVLAARAPAAEALAAQGRLIRLVDGSTFGVVGSDRPGWRLHAGFDLPSCEGMGGRMGRLCVTPASEGERLERIAVTPGELRIADRGFARPDGLRHVVEHGGDLLVRVGTRSLKLAEPGGQRLGLAALCAKAEREGTQDRPVWLLHGRKSHKNWPPLALRLIVEPLPPDAAEAARARLERAGQREGYTPSAAAAAGAGHIVLLTSLSREQGEAGQLLDLYRLRWQVEVAFKRLKSLLAMRSVPAKDERLARTWLCANLLVALMAEDLGADFGESFP